MKNVRIKIAAMITSVSCILQCVPVIAVNEENTNSNGEYMYISSADELNEIAKRCSLDSYSKGKTVVINQDIDFSGKDFSPLTYWDGMLDGGGHKISGISVTLVDSQRGFIGIVGENGTVKNLTVEANITTKKDDGNKNVSKIINKIKGDVSERASDAIKKIAGGDGISSIGCIAGINKGTLTNCHSSGSVEASSETGGICGINEQSGRIEGCNNSADVDADFNTGGIVGKNNGLVKWCTNDGKINSDPNESAQNAGGICGRSYGAVEQCTNNGEVGYKNTGYNVGGITGCQNGYIAECINNAYIRGRKDVGGITGQFEPYTNIDFSEDELQKKVKDNIEQLKKDVNSTFDDISDRNKKIQESYKQFLSDIGLNPDVNGTLGSSLLDSLGVSSTLKDAIGRAGDHGQQIADTISEAQSTASEISDTASRLSESITQSNNELNTLIDKTSKAMDSGTDDTGKLIDQLVSNLEDIQNDKGLEDLISQATETVEDVRSRGINPDIDVNLGSSRQLKDIASDVSDILEPFVSMSGDLSETVESARQRHEKIQSVIDELKQFVNELPTPKPISTILPIKTAEPSKSASIFSKTAYAADDNEKSTVEKLLDMDIRDLDIEIRRNVAGETKDAAVIRYSINYGNVEGMNDTGGIAGCVGFDSLAKPEENINISGEYSLNPSTAIKSVIGECINNGEITAKNMYSGGITGYSDIGSVKECISTGKVTVTDGGYAGGISALNSNNITHCISTSDIQAQSDAGGIAGKGKNIDVCYALARIDSDGEKVGAIAGSASGNVRYNYFLKEKISGVDGIDYGEKAQPVEKNVIASNSGKLNEQMTGFWDNDWICATGDLYMPQLRAFTENSAEGIGDILRAESADATLFRFKVKFIVNDETVKEFRVDYDYKLKDEEIPQLEKGNNTYGDWDKSTSEPIIRNTVFTAVYNQSMSTLSYGGEPPKLLVEGNFKPNTLLQVNESPGSLIVDDNDYDAIVAYEIKITEGDSDYDGNINVRVRQKDADKHIAIGCIENGAVVITDSEIDGSYIKFKMERPGGFIVLKKKSSGIVMYIIIIFLLLAAAAFIYAFIKKKMKKKKSDKKEEYLDAAKDEELNEENKAQTEDVTEDEDGGEKEE